MLSSEGRKCGPRTSRVKDQDDRSRIKSRTLQGFSGSHFAEEVNDDGVKVLTESISSSDNGSWRALGLIRNELTRDVGGVEVYASLYTANGSLLKKVSASVPVDRIRPGEPAPFSIASDIPVSMVARVDWEAVPNTPGATTFRSILVKTYWQQPYGQPDGPDSVAPYILSAGLTNLGPSIHDALLVVGWLDDLGRLVWLETSPALKGTQQIIPHNGGAVFDKIRVSVPEVSRRLHNLETIMWVVAK